MPKQVISDIFESLGQTAGATVKQMAQEPKKILETAARQSGIKPSEEGNPLQQNLNPEKESKEKQEKAAKIAAQKRRLAQLRAELQAIQAQKKQELPKQVSGKPGFSEEKAAIKQLQVEKEKKKLPPVVSAAQSKASAEKRIIGAG